MRYAIAVITIWSLLMGVAVASESEKEAAAEAAALTWLAEVDAAEYGTSWENAATLFKRQVTSQQWVQAIAGVRQALGEMKSRRLLSATYATTLPGAPDGEYVVLQFQSTFANKSSAVETVTPMFDDGHWRVSGYYVK